MESRSWLVTRLPSPNLGEGWSLPQTYWPLLFIEKSLKRIADADRTDRRAQARRHYVYRHGGLQRTRPTRRQSRSRAIVGTSSFVARNLSAVSRHRNQNHWRRFPGRIRERVEIGRASCRERV